MVSRGSSSAFLLIESLNEFGKVRHFRSIFVVSVYPCCQGVEHALLVESLMKFIMSEGTEEGK